MIEQKFIENSEKPLSVAEVVAREEEKFTIIAEEIKQEPNLDRRTEKEKRLKITMLLTQIATKIEQ